MSTKPVTIKPDDICEVLDRTLIDQQCGVALFYYHTFSERGFWLVNMNTDKPNQETFREFVSNSMHKACSVFNKTVKDEYNKFLESKNGR